MNILDAYGQPMIAGFAAAAFYLAARRDTSPFTAVLIAIAVLVFVPVAARIVDANTGVPATFVGATFSLLLAWGLDWAGSRRP